LLFRQIPAFKEMRVYLFFKTNAGSYVTIRNDSPVVKIWMKTLFVERRRNLTIEHRITYIVFIENFNDNDRNFSLPVRYNVT
jgi:hypothetical protein